MKTLKVWGGLAIYKNKQTRTEFYHKCIYGWTLHECISCNGSQDTTIMTVFQNAKHVDELEKYANRALKQTFKQI